MNHAEALAATKESLAIVVPGADIESLRSDDMFRDVLDLDSLDFLRFIETLGEKVGVRIDDEDTPQLTTLAGAVDFLVARTR